MRNSWFLLSAAVLVPVIALGPSMDAHAVNLALGAGVRTVTIDFEELAAGTYLTGNEWADYGVKITVASNRQRRNGSGDLPLRLFDSDCVARVTSGNPLPKCTGGDNDLATGSAFGTAPQGNVLIIQEDNSRSSNRDDLGAPDDDVHGGLITFWFDQAVSIGSFGFLDFDDRDRGEGYIYAYTGADDTEAAVTFNLSDLSYLVNMDFTGDNSLREFDGFGEATYSRLEVKYPGSGAITHLQYTQEVAPGGSDWSGDPETRFW
ncbi:MAG: hypothetical protein HC812_07355 [Leptolyngbya sp. RL_3_1]|nr:hypothetical protein [Leptolyngbya sp. RL_3_1]